jgi:hypothetical protein
METLPGSFSDFGANIAEMGKGGKGFPFVPVQSTGILAAGCI